MGTGNMANLTCPHSRHSKEKTMTRSARFDQEQVAEALREALPSDKQGPYLPDPQSTAVGRASQITEYLNTIEHSGPLTENDVHYALMGALGGTSTSFCEKWIPQITQALNKRMTELA
ncbi:hypothetical protein ACFYPB_40370 [Streptomyces olivaceoviridis]|uniref:hypothetical protein n=1 Tax=Streptomyces olivaceoviridis TaxID=1921 RepID=UPI0036B24B45